VAFGLAWEIWAVWLDKESGDTLTEQIRPLLGHPFVWWMAAGLAVWAVLHLFFGRA
jgi:hypothetical protein